MKLKCNIEKMLQQSATALVLGLSLIATNGIAGQAIPESDEPIKLAMLEWTGQQTVTRVTGAVLEKMGYKVEYVTSGTYTQFIAIPDGGITATMEVWSSNTGEHYRKAMESGKVENLGPLGLEPIETWYFNASAKKACPGLPDWNALKSCAETLAVAETYPDGRLLDYPADWGTTNVDRIAALGLPFQSIPAGSEGALVSEIKSAESNKRPLLVMFWSPHWVHAIADLKPVALPPYEKGCFEDPAIGINTSSTYDCDWQRGDILKLAWVGMKDKWPAAHKLIKAIHVSNDIETLWMRDIDAEGKDINAVVKRWLDENENIWSKWIESAKSGS